MGLGRMEGFNFFGREFEKHRERERDKLIFEFNNMTSILFKKS